MIDSGLYAVVLALGRPARIRIGKMGVLRFGQGTYIYIGSAKRNLIKRVARHRKREKLLKWHIDYLRRQCRWIGFNAYTNIEDECELAERIEKAVDGSRPHKRFGASDCKCVGHLVYTEMEAEKALGMIGDI